MRRRALAPAAAHAAFAALSALAAAGQARGQDACAFCHMQRSEDALRAPVEDQASSAHGAADMSCADCHGGARGEASIRAHAPEAGFVARPSPEEIVELCGGCHADAGRIGAVGEGLPTDQLELYRQSGHGLALARGNEGAATCVSCHGNHRVAPVSDPSSMVYPDNVASTCGGCHSDPAAMTRTGMPLNQTRRWRRSIHGRAFVDEEDDRSPTCNGCHDAHGGITGLDDVAACGRCHEAQERTFLESPHAEVFDRLGFVSCVDCHGTHDIREAHASLIGVMRDSTCMLCHTSEQPIVFETIRRFGTLRAAAAAASARGREALAGLSPELRQGAQARQLAATFARASAALDRGIHAFNDAEVEQAVRLMTESATSAVALERANQREELAGTNLLLALLAAVVVAITAAASLFSRRRA